MYYSTPPRADGFGAQLQNIIWDILYTKEYLKEEYVLTIPSQIEHNYLNNPNFVNELFEFTNLRNLCKLHSEVAEPITHIRAGESYTEIENNLSKYINSHTMQVIQANFLTDKISPFDSKYFNIAIHIRHFNAHDSREIYINDEQYYKLYQIMQQKYPGDNVRFHIYSQGSLNEFELFKSEKTIFHLNEPIQDTFLGFVFADVLCITSSSFSYIAAQFRKNKVYAFQFWHKLSSDWEVIE